MSTAFQAACEKYAASGVEVEAVLKRLEAMAISMHCWQGDDVAGFERAAALDGGIAVTGNYPGRARNADELRADLDEAMRLIPGTKRLNLHAIYAERRGGEDRNAMTVESFAPFLDWAADRGIGLDFNPTFFSHPKAASGFTLSHHDRGIRQFWIEHGIACRKIGEAFGKRLGKTCVTNVWIPDGSKDIPVDRLAPRERLREALDAVFAEKLDPRHNLDAVESKLFGIGSESYVVGSHEFYMGYAQQHGKLLCLDSGHFHPTETIADKLSAVLLFLPEVLLHVSRGVRWDSDHVVIYNDELRMIAEEVVRHGYDRRVHIGLDYFDASINRIAAWVIGMRAMQKALLTAMLEPTAKLAALENAGDYTSRLALLEELKSMPWQAVWDEYCRRQNVPVGAAWLDEVKHYEKSVLAKRG